MVARVSTYGTTNTLFNQTQRLQSSYAQVSFQASSGLRSEGFEGIASDTQRLLKLQGESDNLVGQSLAIKSAQNRISALQNTLNTVNETLSKVSSFLVNMQNGLDLTGTSAANVAQATVLRDALVSNLNAQAGGDYLFGGSVYNAPPVDITDAAYTPAATPAVADFDYYQGDDVIDSVRTSDTFRMNYGITANNPAFEKALRALSIIIANPTDTTLIASAYDLNREAINGVASLSGELLSRSNIVASAASLNEATTAYLGEAISGLRDSDTAAAAVKLSQYETQLQASFSSLSKLLQLRLTDFLR